MAAKHFLVFVIFQDLMVNFISRKLFSDQTMNLIEF